MNKTTLVDLPIERPIRVYQGTYGQSERVEPPTPERPWAVRTRGAGVFIKHDYECPVHGRFEVGWRSSEFMHHVLCAVSDPCTEVCPWQPPRVGIGWAAGEVES